MQSSTAWKPVAMTAVFILILFAGLRASGSEKNNLSRDIASIEICRDDNSYSFDSIQVFGDQIFNQYTGEKLQLKDTYWLRIIINNSGLRQGEHYLIFRHNLYFDKIELYQLNDGGGYTKNISGHLVPEKLRTVGGPQKSKVPFSVAGGDNTELYLRVYTSLEKNFSLANIEIIDEADYEEGVKRSYYGVIFSGGIMLIIMVLTISLYFFSKDRIYLFYFLYLLSTLIYFLHISQLTEKYIFYRFPRLDLTLYYFLTLAQPIYLWFFYELLKHEKISEWIKMIRKYCIVISVFWLVVFGISFINIPFSKNLNDTLSTINIVFVAVTFIFLFKRVSTTTKIVLSGALIFVLFAFFSLAIYYLTGNRSTMFLYRTGFLIEIVMFSIAVNYIYYRERQEKYRAMAVSSRIMEDKSNVESEKLKLVDQLRMQNQDLATKAIKLGHAETMLDNISESLSHLYIDSDHNYEIKKILNTLRVNKNTENWKEFELCLNKIHPRFYAELLDLYPALSKTEIKLSALIRLNLSTKQIAALTGKSTNSIDVARSRLRKKIGLHNGSLTAALLTIGN